MAREARLAELQELQLRSARLKVRALAYSVCALAVVMVAALILVSLRQPTVGIRARLQSDALSIEIAELVVLPLDWDIQLAECATPDAVVIPHSMRTLNEYDMDDLASGSGLRLSAEDGGTLRIQEIELPAGTKLSIDVRSGAYSAHLIHGALPYAPEAGRSCPT